MMSETFTQARTPTDKQTRFLVVTDLDGTLLDHHDYTWNPAQPALDFLRQLRIPVVINTSKTAREVLSLQKQIGIEAAFIVENGSAIFIPDLEKLEPLPELDLCERHWIKVLGQAKTAITKKLAALREANGWNFEGFSDWNTAQIVAATGLSEEAANEAAQRQYSEPLLWRDSQENFQAFASELNNLGLKILKGGRFIHVLGNTDKGAAALWLKQFYSRHHHIDYKLIALGDGPNDIDMLNASDIAVLVKSPAHDFPEVARQDAVIRTQACGPSGWNEAFQMLSSQLSTNLPSTQKAEPSPFMQQQTGKYHG